MPRASRSVLCLPLVPAEPMGLVNDVRHGERREALTKEYESIMQSD